MDKALAAGFFAGMLGMMLVASIVIKSSINRGSECTIETTRGMVTHVRIGYQS